MGGRDEEKQLQANKVQQHLLPALHRRLLQEGVQQPCAEGERCAVAVHLQPQHQGDLTKAGRAFFFPGASQEFPVTFSLFQDKSTDLRDSSN